MSGLGIPYSIKKYASGIQSIQKTNVNDEATMLKIQAFCESEFGLSAYQVAHKLGISVVLSKELLLVYRKKSC